MKSGITIGTAPRRGWRAGAVTSEVEVRRLRIHVARLDGRVKLARQDLEWGIAGPEPVLAAMQLREQAGIYLARLTGAGKRRRRKFLTSVTAEDGSN